MEIITSKSKVRERKMSRLSLKEVLARNSDDESDDFSQLDSASQARGRGRPGGEAYKVSHADSDRYMIVQHLLKYKIFASNDGRFYSSYSYN